MKMLFIQEETKKEMDIAYIFDLRKKDKEVIITMWLVNEETDQNTNAFKYNEINIEVVIETYLTRIRNNTKIQLLRYYPKR